MGDSETASRIAILETRIEAAHEEIEQLRAEVRELALSDARTGVVLQSLETLWRKFDAVVVETSQLARDSAVADAVVTTRLYSISAALSVCVSVVTAIVTAVILRAIG